jgi:hypothetical protein
VESLESDDDYMKDDKALREVLQTKIAQIKAEYPKIVIKEISQTMANTYNVKHGLSIDIINGIYPIENLTYDMLYKLMKSIHTLTASRFMTLDSSDLYAPSYFTDIEIEEFEKPVPEEEDNFDIVIKDWHETTMDQYRVIHIFTDINEKIRWRNYNKLRFNPETQRDLIEIKSQKGTIVKKLDINRKAVNNMKELMIKGLYFPVPCIININPDKCEEPVIIRGNTLTIPKENHIDLIEGFHNYIAECEVKDENPDWNFPCELKLMFLDIDRCNDFINQMDQKTHFREPQKARIDTQSQENFIIDRLNSNSKYHLVGTIDKDMRVYLYKIIKYIFEVQDRKQAVDIFEHLKDNLNYIIENTDHYNIAFNKTEFFVYLMMIKSSIDSNIDFESIYRKIDINSIFEEFKIRNAPSASYYAKLKSIINEVIKNANV